MLNTIYVGKMRLTPRKIFASVFLVIIFYLLLKTFLSLKPERNLIDSQDYEIYDSDLHRNQHQMTDSTQNVSYSIRKVDVITELIERYKLDWDYRLKESPWAVATSWMSKEHVHPEDTPALGAVLRAMATRRITAADFGYKGTQLKMTLMLEGDQRVVFKPKWFSRDHVIEGPPYAGEDRHNGEIAAFHLGRLLDFRRTPLAVGRVVNLETEIKPVAKQQLLDTFFKRGNNTCFYGKCYYCKGEETGLCGDGVYMEGTIVLWLPDAVSLKVHRHPWSRTYKHGVLAQWEKDDAYCLSTVLRKTLYSEGRRLLDIVDTAVFDYLIGNADRHHYETVGQEDTSVMMILDNAKSFGNPFYDEKSILAPLYQCCRIRESTWLRLLMLEDGILSEVLESVLSADPISPVITHEYYLAMDRRLSFILNTIKTCINKFSVNEVLIKNR